MQSREANSCFLETSKSRDLGQVAPLTTHVDETEIFVENLGSIRSSSDRWCWFPGMCCSDDPRPRMFVSFRPEV